MDIYSKYRNIDYKRPRKESIIDFLKAKGWNQSHEDKSFHYFVPPTKLTFPKNPSFNYLIPKDEKSFDYEEWTYRLLISFSQLYDIELQDLFDVLSVDYQKVQRVFKQEAIEV